MAERRAVGRWLVRGPDPRGGRALGEYDYDLRRDERLVVVALLLLLFFRRLFSHIMIHSVWNV